jgi:hypothetical protein
MIVLTYLESKKPPAELLSVGSSQYTTINPHKRKEVKVMSAGFDELGDSDDYEEGIPEVDEVHFIRSKEEYQKREVLLRMTAFSKICKNVQNNIREGMDECQLQNVITKFDPEALKLRRAFSMGGKANVSDGEWSAEEINSGYLNSEPEDVNDYMFERRYSWPLLK